MSTMIPVVARGGEILAPHLFWDLKTIGAVLVPLLLIIMVSG
jgi:hypothetical protein